MKKKKSYICDIVIGGIQNVIDDLYPKTPIN